jgi:hypothetical protein
MLKAILTFISKVHSFLNQNAWLSSTLLKKKKKIFIIKTKEYQASLFKETCLSYLARNIYPIP